MVFAQGPATARALQRHGVDATLPDRGYTSEDLLSHNFFSAVDGKRVVRLAGQGGRDLLLSSLRARGCDASAIALYQRVPARWQQRHRDILHAYADPVLVISSAETLEGLRLRLVNAQWERLRNWRVLVSSVRLEAAALDAGCAHVHVARSAASADLRAGLMALTEASRGR
jgi:uroporphyrinogen-III synthase